MAKHAGDREKRRDAKRISKDRGFLRIHRYGKHGVKK